MVERIENQGAIVKIYLDVCCLCRPFDDQQNKKIRLETEAIMAILDRCTRDWELVGSVVINDEISLIPDIERRLKVKQKLTLISENIEVNDAVFRQALIYQRTGLKLYDSLHLACAHIGKTIFLTTDNTIINTARKNSAISIRVDNPVHWLMEVSTHENNQ
jgi:predicted nucleic acid-binding protein